jgi:hypothetical protein
MKCRIRFALGIEGRNNGKVKEILLFEGGGGCHVFI